MPGATRIDVALGFGPALSGVILEGARWVGVC